MEMLFQHHLNKLCILIVSTIVIMLLTGCTKKDTDIKIGALLALTGSGANYGKSLQQGIELAKDEINQHGGINGKKLTIVYEDSQGDAKTGVSAFNKLITVDKVPLVIGSISSVILAVAPIADEKQVVLLNSSAISPKICEKATNYLFSIMVSGAQEARFMAQEYVRKHKNEPIAVIYSNNSSGLDTKKVFVEEMISAGGSIAIEEGYELGTSDYRTSLGKIKASKAKSAYLIAFSSKEFAGILRQSREIGLEIQWFSYSGFETKETLELAGNSAEGVSYSYPDYSVTKQLYVKFQENYQKRYGYWADIYTATSYDGVNMIGKVMSTYGNSSLQLQDGIRKSGEYSGVFGLINFGEKQCVNKPLIVKIVKGQKYAF